MQKKFLTNLGFLVLVNLLIKPFYILGIDAEVQNVVGAQDYGNYFAILNFSFLLNIVNDMGITNFNNRNIAQHRHLLEKHFPRILVLRFVLLLIYAAVTILAGALVGYDSGQVIMLAFLTLNQGLVASVFYLRSNLSGLHLFRQDSIISVLDRALLILFCGVLLWTNIAGGAFQIEWFVYAQTLSYAITFVIAFILVRRSVSQFKFKWDPPFWIEILKQSLPFAILVMLMFLYHRMDTVLLERLVPNGDVQAGIYAQGFRFLDALNNFSFLFAVLLFPIFSRLLKEKEDIKSLLDLSTKILLSGVGVIALTCFFFRYEIINWRYSEEIELASRCFGILILTALCHSTGHIFGTLLTAAGRLKSLNYLSFIAVLLGLSLNLWLAPKYLAFGSTIANLCTNSFVAIASVLIVQRIFGYSISGSVLGRLLLLGGLLVLIGNYATSLPWNWFVNLIIMMLSGLLLAIILRLIDVKGLIGILKDS
jgi:O-antigen/teichoic acid export membrane protein